MLLLHSNLTKKASHSGTFHRDLLTIRYGLNSFWTGLHIMAFIMLSQVDMMLSLISIAIIDWTLEADRCRNGVAAYISSWHSGPVRWRHPTLVVGTARYETTAPSAFRLTVTATEIKGGRNFLLHSRVHTQISGDRKHPQRLLQSQLSSLSASCTVSVYFSPVSNAN